MHWHPVTFYFHSHHNKPLIETARIFIEMKDEHNEHIISKAFEVVVVHIGVDTNSKYWHSHLDCGELTYEQKRGSLWTPAPRLCSMHARLLHNNTSVAVGRVSHLLHARPEKPKTHFTTKIPDMWPWMSLLLPSRCNNLTTHSLYCLSPIL